MLVARLSRPLPGGFPPETNNKLSHRHLGLVIDGLRADARQPAELAGPALTLADLRQFRPSEAATADPQATAPGERLASTPASQHGYH
jgi:hypothetical protein